MSLQRKWPYLKEWRIKDTGFAHEESRPTGAACLHRAVFTYKLQMQSWKRIGLQRKRGSLKRAPEKDHRQSEEGGREGREWKKMAKEVRSVKGRGRHRGGAMREKVWRRKAHRKKWEIWYGWEFLQLRFLSLQMEVNVKQSLVSVSGGINSLERDWAVREVNACLSFLLL